MLKIYVAGKWKERKQVMKIMEMFEARGHLITCDWTKHTLPENIELDRAHKEKSFVKDYDWAQNGHKTYAQEDLEGVRNCEVLVAYMPDPEILYKGAWIEIGIALGLDKKVIIIGKDVTTVFLSLPNITVVSYKEEAISIINSLQFDREYEEGAKYKDTDHFVM